MKTYEAVAKSAEEAIEEILKVMKVSLEDVDIVIEEANKGLFGFLKQKQVKVVATLKPGVSDFEEKAENEKTKKLVKSTEAVPEKSIEKKFEAQTESDKLKVYEDDENEDFSDEDIDEDIIEELNDDRENISHLLREPQDVIRDVIGQVASNIQRDIEVNVKESENTIYIDVKGEDLSILIGKHGRTLDAMRYLISLMVNRGRGKDNIKRIVFDVEGYRKKRDGSLERLARSVATKVIKTKKEVKLEPMNPYERRIVHSALQRNKLVSTRSEGEEPFRSVIVFLK